MDNLAIFIGIFIAIPLGMWAGIWVMHRNWEGTKGAFDVPIDKRKEWLAEKRADNMKNIFLYKVLFKMSLPLIAVLIFRLFNG